MCECLAALWEVDRAGVCIEIRGGYLLYDGMPDSLPRPNFAHNPTAGG